MDRRPGRDPVGEEEVGWLASMMRPTWAPASANPSTGGMRSMVATASRSSLRNGQLNSAFPAPFQHERDKRLLGPRPESPIGEAVGDAEVIAPSVGEQVQLSDGGMRRKVLRGTSTRVALIRISQRRQSLLEAEVTEGPPCGRAVEWGAVDEPGRVIPDPAGSEAHVGVADRAASTDVERPWCRSYPLRLAEPEGDGTSGWPARCRRESRSSPRLGCAPPAGAVALAEGRCRLEHAGSWALAEHADDGHRLGLSAYVPGTAHRRGHDEARCARSRR